MARLRCRRNGAAYHAIQWSDEGDFALEDDMLTAGLLAAPALAQNVTEPPPATNTPAPDTVGPRELQNFSLPGTATRPSDQQPATAPPAAKAPTQTAKSAEPAATTMGETQRPAPRRPAPRQATVGGSAGSVTATFACRRPRLLISLRQQSRPHRILPRLHRQCRRRARPPGSPAYDLAMACGSPCACWRDGIPALASPVARGSGRRAAIRIRPPNRSRAAAPRRDPYYRQRSPPFARLKRNRSPRACVRNSR